jgi:hypothetical protein
MPGAAFCDDEWKIEFREIREIRVVQDVHFFELISAAAKGLIPL